MVARYKQVLSCVLLRGKEVAQALGAQSWLQVGSQKKAKGLHGSLSPEFWGIAPNPWRMGIPNLSWILLERGLPAL